MTNEEHAEAISAALTARLLAVSVAWCEYDVAFEAIRKERSETVKAEAEKYEPRPLSTFCPGDVVDWSGDVCVVVGVAVYSYDGLDAKTSPNVGAVNLQTGVMNTWNIFDPTMSLLRGYSVTQ